MPVPRDAAATIRALTGAAMHFDSHQNIIADLEARIVTIRDSL